jgi:ribose transport system permease protein
MTAPADDQPITAAIPAARSSKLTASAATPSAHRVEPSSHRRSVLLGGVPQRFAVVGVWAVMIAGFAAALPDLFLRAGTFQTIFGSQQALVFLALALVVTFAVGEFDLSVPSILGISATLVPVLNVNHGVGIVASVAIAFLVALAAGAVNGVVIVLFGVDPIVTTLGMSTLLVGISLWLADLTTVGGLDPALAKIAVTPVGGLPISFFYGLVLAAVIAYIMWRTPLGRHMTFVGANREVARLAGISVRRIRFGSYLASAAIAGAGGIILVCGIGGFDPNSGATYLLPAFAAAFLSTAVVVPGRFNPIGALIAIYFLETGIVGLQLAGYSGWISSVFFGAALVIAVTISTVLRRRTTRT